MWLNPLGFGKVLLKIRGHEEDIQGLSWSPSKYRDVLLEDRDHSFGDTEGKNAQKFEVDSMLAVSSRDKTVSIWSTKTGQQLASIRLPGLGNGSKSKMDASKMTWTTCFWWKREILFTSGNHGELLEWNLDRLSKRPNANIFKCDGQSNEMQVLKKIYLPRNVYVFFFVMEFRWCTRNTQGQFTASIPQDTAFNPAVKTEALSHSTGKVTLLTSTSRHSHPSYTP